MTPKRIQRSRAKGWRMPEGAVYVGRPTKWGNPFTASNARAPGLPVPCTPYIYVSSKEEAVETYRLYLNECPDLIASLDELRGRDLACWCPMRHRDGSPVLCHADVLLELANKWQ